MCVTVFDCELFRCVSVIRLCNMVIASHILLHYCLASWMTSVSPHIVYSYRTIFTTTTHDKLSATDHKLLVHVHTSLIILVTF